MIGSIIKGITGVTGKVADTIKHKNEVKAKAQEMQHNYLKEKVSIGLFTFIAITVVLPYFFWVLSPFFKHIPLMTEILEDYQVILNKITLDRIFNVVFTLLGVGGGTAITTAIGKVVMARKKADKDAEIKKEEIKAPAKKIKIEYSKNCSDTLSNNNTYQMVKALGNELKADKVIITGADRSRIVHNRLIKSGKTNKKYQETQHGREMGYKAADIKVYKGDAQISPREVALKAETMEMIGGIGIYNTFTHVDIRDRKEDGSCYKWGLWS